MIVILCEITNFLVTQPLKEVTASEVCRVLVEEFIAYFSTPVRIVCDQDPAIYVQFMLDIVFNNTEYKY